MTASVRAERTSNGSGRVSRTASATRSGSMSAAPRPYAQSSASSRSRFSSPESARADMRRASRKGRRPKRPASASDTSAGPPSASQSRAVSGERAASSAASATAVVASGVLNRSSYGSGGACVIPSPPVAIVPARTAMPARRAPRGLAEGVEGEAQLGMAADELVQVRQVPHGACRERRAVGMPPVGGEHPGQGVQQETGLDAAQLDERLLGQVHPFGRLVEAAQDVEVDVRPLVGEPLGRAEIPVSQHAPS